MTTEIINIQIREDGSRVVTRNIEGMGTAATKASGPLDRLKGLIATLATGAAVIQLGRLADEYTNLQNRLRLVTTGAENLKRVNKELLTVSNQTRSDLSATSELYFRLASNTKELGLSQKDLLGFTKSVNQAIILSGASSAEAAGGLRQLAQGIASNTLRGEELNSVLENLPKVAEIIRNGLGVTIGEMRKLGAEGKISAKDIIDAFQKAGKSLDEEFGTTVPTLSQSFTVLKNNFLVFVGQLNESTGITATLSKLILGLANNLDTLVPILAAVAVGIAAAFAPGIIASFAAQIKALWALILANPFVAIAAVVATAVTALYAFRDAISLGIDETTTLGDLMRAIWEQIVPVIKGVAGYISEFFKWLTSKGKETFDGLSDSNEASWLTILRYVARTIDAILGLLLGLHDAARRIFSAISDFVKTTFGNAVEQVKALFAGDFDKVLEIGSAQLANAKNTGMTLGSAIGDGLNTGFGAIMEGGIEARLNKAIDRAKEIGIDRLKSANGEGELEGGGPPGAPPSPAGDSAAAKKAAKELERLKDALRSLKDAVDPVGAAERQLAEAQDTLTRSVAAGLIPLDESKIIYKELKFSLRDQLDPLGALNEELDKHIEVLKMSADQAEIEVRMQQELQNLRRSGKILTEEETAALRAKLIVEQELAKIASARDGIESNSAAGQLNAARETIAAMQQISELTQGDRFNVLDGLLGGSLDETQSAMDARLEQLNTYYEIAKSFRDADVANAKIAAEAMNAIEQERVNLQVAQVQTGLTAIAGLMNSHNKTAFKIGQAAAIANATITGITMAMNAYESASKIPYVGWILGPLAAAGAAATAAANISKIRSQKPPAYRTGGSYTIGGSGGIDSQVVSLRGTPGEKININTPSQANAMERIANNMESFQGGGRGDVHMDLTIVQQGRPTNDTPRQEAREMKKRARELIPT